MVLLDVRKWRTDLRYAAACSSATLSSTHLLDHSRTLASSLPRVHARYPQAPDLKCCVLSPALFTPLRPSLALAGVLFAVGTVYQSIGYLAPGKKKRNDLA